MNCVSLKQKFQSIFVACCKYQLRIIGENEVYIRCKYARLPAGKTCQQLTKVNKNWQKRWRTPLPPQTGFEPVGKKVVKVKRTTFTVKLAKISKNNLK